MDHYAVMLVECINLLAIKEDGIYVDGTLGRAGHSSQILKRIPKGHLYAFDKDMQAIAESQKKLSQIGENFTLVHGGFEDLDDTLNALGVQCIDGLLLDVGVSSPQFDDAKRGFSYRYDARLDMRMDQAQTLSAHEVVNTYSFHDLQRIIRQYGEEPFAKQIARAIECEREKKLIDTTLELVEVIKKALPAKVISKKGHPAKKTFQAIRIEVNDELQALQTVLYKGIKRLKEDGRVCVISFHSLEDRIVKEVFQAYTKAEKVNKRLPILETQKKEYELLNKKPLLPSERELAANKRSHSAKLRGIKKVSKNGNN
ncbi:MAG: 16S rRNA (cytosine(1402)-N(4))-methyltransferase RsmH [Breznakia sp.]